MIGTILESALSAAEALGWSAAAYIVLALLVKGWDDAAADGKKALSEMRLNVGWYFLDNVLIAPALGFAVGGLGAGLRGASLVPVPETFWAALGGVVTGLSALFLGDFISYWRHRLEHSRLIWPAHAIHHSDRQMTWLTLTRFHPINRLVTVFIDGLFLAMLGFPPWALVLNELFRHYYGEFIHADLPWTYGPLRFVFVSPAMHQWHHARDPRFAGTNFATVFSVFDQAFGTYHLPGPCDVRLGVEEDLGKSLWRQLLWPFTIWWTAVSRERSRG